MGFIHPNNGHSSTRDHFRRSRILVGKSSNALSSTDVLVGFFLFGGCQFNCKLIISCVNLLGKVILFSVLFCQIAALSNHLISPHLLLFNSSFVSVVYRYLLSEFNVYLYQLQFNFSILIRMLFDRCLVHYQHLHAVAPLYLCILSLG